MSETQTDTKRDVGLGSLIQFISHYGSLSFFIWWILLAILSPLWGWYVWDMSEHMIAKADFLISKGQEVSPTIELFKHLTWAQILGVGSLLGFLFYALPLALVLSLFESIALSFENVKIKWCVRVLSLTWLLTPLGDVLHAFTKSYVLSFVMAIITMAVCSGLGNLFVRLQLNVRKAPSKRKLIVVLTMIICVSHYLTHPVLHMVVKPNEYKEIHPITLVRDWLLLDNQGSSWVNSWYYNHTAIAMEKEMITTFQPMVVGLYHINEKVWKNHLAYKFSTRKGDRWTKLKFIQLNENDDIDELLKKSWIDFVAIDHKDYHQFEKEIESWPKQSYGFFSLKPDSNLPKEILITPKNYYGPFYERWGFKYRKTPVNQRRDHVQDAGYDLEQTQVNLRHKKGLVQMMSSKEKLILLLIFLLGGALLILYRIMLLSLQIHPLLFCLILLMSSYFWAPGLINNIQFWSSEKGLNSSSIEKQILATNLLWKNPNSENIEMLLKQDLAKDLRLGMWQVACMGQGYSKCKPETKLKIEEWMQNVLNHYSTYPFNFRYKIIESAMKIPKLVPLVDKKAKQEKQIYVRWYAEDFGIGI